MLPRHTNFLGNRAKIDTGTVKPKPKSITRMKASINVTIERISIVLLCCSCELKGKTVN